MNGAIERPKNLYLTVNKHTFGGSKRKKTNKTFVFILLTSNMAALNQPPFTLLQAMEQCGLPANDAEVFAREAYMDDFDTAKQLRFP